MSNHALVYAAVPISVIVAVGLLRKWRSMKWKKCTNTMNLRGKTFLITGANSGIGLETAKALVKRNARVIFACRDLENAKASIASIRKEQGNVGEMIPMQLDLGSLESIENFVQVIKAGFHKIDVLINNAGVAVPLKLDMKTKDGFEINMGVNHLGHFYLTNLLLDHLKRASPSRVVIVSSTLHEKGVVDLDDLNLRKQISKGNKSDRTTAYQNSKLLNVYFGMSLSEKLNDSGVTVYTCCPGFTFTNLFRHSFKWYHIFLAPFLFTIMRSAKQGSETVVYCATEYGIEGITGKFYRDCAEYDSKYKFDREVQSKLWTLSEEMIKARKPL